MCEISSGWSKSACSNKGGIKSFVAIPVTNVTFTVSNGNVTAVSHTGKAYRFSLDVNSAFANSTPTGDRNNNSLTYIEEVMMMLKDDELATQQQVEKLAAGYYVLVAEYRNGKNKVFGRENGLRLTTGPTESGQNGGDMNGSTLNFAGEENALPPHISNALVSSLLLAAS